MKFGRIILQVNTHRLMDFLCDINCRHNEYGRGFFCAVFHASFWPLLIH